MTLWFAALLGLIQGLTEFIPVSSTAHLRIAPALLGQPDPGAAYTAVIQLGTLVAVLVYFARDLFVDLPRAMVREPRTPAGRLPWLLVIGTVPIVVLGLSLKDFIVGDARSLYVVAGALAGVGLLLIVIDRRGGAHRALADIGVRDAVLIGLAQSLALVPGVSRSGATICMALLLGFARRDAARFSFLLSVPAIAGAGIFEAKDAAAELGSDAIGPIVVGTVVAAVSGYAAIAWLMRWLSTRPMTSFGIYRIALGAVILALVAAGVLAPL